MKILLTGASSFTGYWFAEALVQAGHRLVAPLCRKREDYHEGARGVRVQRLATLVELVEECPFGSPRFMELAEAGSYDLLCHHGAQVSNYRSPDFDIIGALRDNTLNLPSVLKTLHQGGLKGMVLTGSIFEANEGAGPQPLASISPYGVSKSLTADLVRYWCHETKLPLGKFVISNPFGALEEQRFCAYLMRTWKTGQVARVNTPAYIRDNIHIGLLAQAYVRFVVTLEQQTSNIGFIKHNPSGYVESQGAFATRLASAMRERLGVACALDFAQQTEFSEPLMRVNTEPVLQDFPQWDEAHAWDDMAHYYSTLLSTG